MESSPTKPDSHLQLKKIRSFSHSGRFNVYLQVQSIATKKRKRGKKNYCGRLNELTAHWYKLTDPDDFVLGLRKPSRVKKKNIVQMSLEVPKDDLNDSRFILSGLSFSASKKNLFFNISEPFSVLDLSHGLHLTICFHIINFIKFLLLGFSKYFTLIHIIDT